jgi:hypothetical protein
LFPYAATQWGIARVNTHDRQPVMLYVHPWEVDPDQPRLSAGALSRFRHYRNLDKTESRLRQLLGDFRFGPMAAVLPQPTRHAPASMSAPLPYLW